MAVVEHSLACDFFLGSFVLAKMAWHGIAWSSMYRSMLLDGGGMPNELSERVRELQIIAPMVQWARLEFETRDGHLVNNSVALVMFGMLPWL